MKKELNDLREFLQKSNVRYTIEEHEPIHTAEQASAARGIDIKYGVKSLVVKVEYGERSDIVLVLISGDRKMDPKKLADILNAKRVHLADKEEVKERTGCEIGSVHPFGVLFGLTVYMDKVILDREFVSFSAGTHTHSVRMNIKNFVSAVKPKIEDLSKEK